MELIGLTDASTLAGVSVSTLRNYLKDRRLTAYEKGTRLLVDRDEVQAVFGLKRLSPLPGETGRIIAVANQKGGVGKTTTAVALAALLSREAPVLAVDCDPQGNLTQAFCLDPDAQPRTLYDVLASDAALADVWLPAGTPLPNLAVVPANLDLADTWRRVAGRVGLELLLRSALLPVAGRFRYVVLDCPPALDMMALNALVAATEVIVPVDMSVFSVRGMVKLMGTLQEVRKVNPALPPPRVVACRTEHTTLSQAIEQELRERFGGTVFRTAIPKGKDVPAAHAARQPLPLHAPEGKPAQAYAALAEEVIRG